MFYQKLLKSKERLVRTTLFYTLYGLTISLLLLLGIYLYRPIETVYFYVYCSLLLLNFFLGLILLNVARKRNEQLVKIQQMNEQIVERLHSSMTQQAQQLKLAALGRFSASIAHEIRNPLGAIAHAIQLLGDENGLNAEDSRLKQLVIKNCDRMNAVIKNVLQLSRGQPAQPQRIDIIPFLEQFKHDFCQANACDIKVLSVANQTLFILFDKSQLEQILVILCDNALKHGQNEEGIVHIKITVTTDLYHTVLTVSDSGKGIPDNHGHDIFEPFFTTLRSGTGMGLFIGRDLCEINQARLSLVKTNRGCCFTITVNSPDE